MKKTFVVMFVVVMLAGGAMLVWSQQPGVPNIPNGPHGGIGPGPGPGPISPGPVGPGPGPMAPGPMGPGPGPGGPHMFMHGPTCPTALVGMITFPPPVLLGQTGVIRLTDQQFADMQALLVKNEETLRPLLQKAMEANGKLREALIADNYDSKKVQNLAGEAAKVENAILQAQLDQWNKIRSILTNEQFRTIRESMRRQVTPGVMGGFKGPVPNQIGPGFGGTVPGGIETMPNNPVGPPSELTE